MKTLLFILLTAPVLAASQRFMLVGWDKNPEPSVTVYEVFLGTERIASVTTNEARILIPYDECVVTVRAINTAGVPSGMSEGLRIPSLWSEIKVTLQFSEDLTTWGPDFLPTSRFARAAISPPVR